MSELTGFLRVGAERARQVTIEGWTEEHDDQHTSDELAVAAAIYAAPRHLRTQARLPMFWPWETGMYKSARKETVEDRIRELEKAGALIVAEIDRLLRLQKATADVG